jgi:putative transposase
MTRQLRIQYPDAFYHVTCRGNERKEIFRNKEDRDKFFQLLARSLDIFNVKLAAYACMPNHFHLLIKTPEGNLAQFMRHFNISYTGAFNRKYHRTGHLYQGRYKAFLIDADNYLLEVSRYIHLNPLRMKSKESREDKWKSLLQNDNTSLPGYITEKRRQEFVDYGIVLDCFGGDNRKARTEYGKFVEEGFLQEEKSSPLEKGKGHGIIGDEDFVEQIKQLFDMKKESVREQPALRELGKVLVPEELIEQYTKLVGIKREELTRKGRQATERAMLMEFLYRLCRITQPEIGRLLGGIDYSAVSQARKRVQLKIQYEPEWGKKFNQIKRQLGQMSRIKI